MTPITTTKGSYLVVEVPEMKRPQAVTELRTSSKPYELNTETKL